MNVNTSHLYAAGIDFAALVRMANATNRQTSNKAGVRSLAKKQDSTRHGFRPEPAARKVAGASGHEDRVRGSAGESAEAARGGKGAALRKMKSARNR